MKDETRRTARSSGAVLEEASRAGVARRPPRIEAVSMGGVVGDHDLNKALELATRLEDEEIVRRLRARS